jgi:hypothetical protein
VKIIHKLSFAPLLLAAAVTPALAGVTINNPASGAQVSSPFTLSALSSSCSSQSVAAMGYSLDNSSDTTIVDKSSIDAQVQSGTGAHTLHVKAWGNKGASCVTDVAITVTGVASSSSGESVVPSDAVSVSNLQNQGAWHAINDSGSGGSSSGSMSVVNSPSRTGNARKFVTHYSNYGDERYSSSFGDDTDSTNFLYDAWVYLASPSTGVANVEMDLNQVMSNGQTVIFGFQCDGWSGTWDYTANKGTPTKPNDQWVHSSAKCNPHSWGANAWHHVQISYSRNDSGVVNYKSVWLDGAEQGINATASSAFALGWAPTLTTNFQLDGATSSSGSSTVYLDDLIVYRW